MTSSKFTEGELGTAPALPRTKSLELASISTGSREELSSFAEDFGLKLRGFADESKWALASKVISGNEEEPTLIQLTRSRLSKEHFALSLSWIGEQPSLEAENPKLKRLIQEAWEKNVSEAKFTEEELYDRLDALQLLSHPANAAFVQELDRYIRELYAHLDPAVVDNSSTPVEDEPLVEGIVLELYDYVEEEPAQEAESSSESVQLVRSALRDKIFSVSGDSFTSEYIFKTARRFEEEFILRGARYAGYGDATLKGPLSAFEEAFKALQDGSGYQEIQQLERIQSGLLREMAQHREAGSLSQEQDLIPEDELKSAEPGSSPRAAWVQSLKLREGESIELYPTPAAAHLANVSEKPSA